MRAPSSPLVDTVDAVLQQQLLSSGFRVINRYGNGSIGIPGARSTFTALRGGILDGIPMLDKGDIDGFVSFLSGKFGVPACTFEEKLGTLPSGDVFVDTRLKCMVIVSAMRAHWHDIAYQKAVADLHALVAGRFPPRARPSADRVHEILASELGPVFSHLVNVYELRAWAAVTGTRVAVRGPRMALANRLVASLVAALAGGHGENVQGKA